MAVYYTSINRGSDGNPGTKSQPFKSINIGSRALAANDLLIIEQGLYQEGGLTFGGVAINYRHFKGEGDVIVDCSGFGSFIAGSNNELTRYSAISNITFKNFSEGFISIGENRYGDNEVYVKNCTFSNEGALYGVPLTKRIYTNGLRAFQCVFSGIPSMNKPYRVSYFSHCVMHDVTSITGQNVEYSAGSISDIYSKIGGINSSTTPPPFTDITTPSEPNLDYNLEHVNLDAYASGGDMSLSIGRVGGNVVTWEPSIYSHSGGVTVSHGANFLSEDARGNGVWSNYKGNYNTDWVDKEIVAGFNDSFQFVEGFGTVTATISENTYTDGAAFASAIQTAIELSDATDTHTVTYGGNLRLDWVADGTVLELNCNSYSTNAAWDEMKMDTTADKTGSVRYYSDHGICIGAIAGSEDDTGPVVISPLGNAKIDFGIEPAATNADMVSPVMSFYIPKTIRSLYVSRTIVGEGEADSTALTSDRTSMVRASNSLFLEDDLPGTTQMDWTNISNLMDDESATITNAYLHWQVDIRLRTNATP